MNTSNILEHEQAQNRTTAGEVERFSSPPAKLGTLAFRGAVDARPSPAVIDIKNLCVTYSGRRRGQPAKLAVNNLSLVVNAGEVFGFLGPNGAGKTTTMNVLLGFTNATGGDAYLFGANVREPIARQRI